MKRFASYSVLVLLLVVVACQRDSVPPTVSVMNPKMDKLISGSITLSATADDNVGVTQVQFRVDGSNVGSAVTEKPYTLVLNTAMYPDREVTITAVAKDAAGNTTTSEPVVAVVANTTGAISGNVLTPVEMLAVQPDLAHQLNIHPQAEFINGEILIKFAPSVAPQVALQALRATTVREISGGVHLVRVEGASIGTLANPVTADDAQATLELLAELRARPDVVYAEPNYVRRAARIEPLDIVPNDDRYALQWHYQAANLPAAWGITTGSPDVVVAVLDTGILFDPKNTEISHPDFDPLRMLPGYDFISDGNSSGDGDGRDPSPYDEGSVERTGFHGTHVAGTIGAATNNQVGVAGVDWNAGLVNVRVLGPFGGTDADIIDAIRWSAGLPVMGVPVNEYSANVINMSLGGPGLSDAIQDALDDATAAGAIVVVAAGNSADDTRFYSPAGQRNVITVGATGRTNDLTYYSNFGFAIEIMAPGGEQYHINPPVIEHGVLSPLADDKGGFVYGFYQGTSMASPHIAGIVALMKSVNPDLDLKSATNYLRSTARAIGTDACGAYDCGAGLVDAAAAVAAAQAGGPAGAFLDVSQSVIYLNDDVWNGSFSISNSGDAPLEWSVTDSGGIASFNTTGGTLGVGQSTTLTFSINPAGLRDGRYVNFLNITGSDRNRASVLTIFTRGKGVADIDDLVVLLYDATKKAVVDQQIIGYEDLYDFRFITVPPGMYAIVAVDPACSKLEDIYVACTPAYFGYSVVTVEAGKEATAFEIPVSPFRYGLDIQTILRQVQ